MVNTEIRLIIFFAAKDREVLCSQQKQDMELTVAHELLIAKFRLKLKKVEKTTTTFRHDLNQIPYDSTVEVRNRFKGLDLMYYGQKFMTLYRSQRSRPSPWQRNSKRQNGCLRRALQIAEKRREAKGKGKKERYIHLNSEVQRIARTDKKAFLSD